MCHRLPVTDHLVRSGGGSRSTVTTRRYEAKNVLNHSLATSAFYKWRGCTLCVHVVSGPGDEAFVCVCARAFKPTSTSMYFNNFVLNLSKIANVLYMYRVCLTAGFNKVHGFH